MTETEADAHSYVFRRLDGSAWAQITFLYELGSPWPLYVGTFNTSWLEALGDAERIRNRFAQVERKRQAKLKLMQQFEQNYDDGSWDQEAC